METLSIIIVIILVSVFFALGFIWFIKIMDILCSKKLNNLEKKVKENLEKMESKVTKSKLELDKEFSTIPNHIYPEFKDKRTHLIKEVLEEDENTISFTFKFDDFNTMLQFSLSMKKYK